MAQVPGNSIIIKACAVPGNSKAIKTSLSEHFQLSDHNSHSARLPGPTWNLVPHRIFIKMFPACVAQGTHLVGLGRFQISTFTPYFSSNSPILYWGEGGGGVFPMNHSY